MSDSQFLGLRSCCYSVEDLEMARKWYAQAFQTEPHFNEPFYVGFHVAGCELGLVPEEGSSSEKGENIFAYWGVEDIHAEFSRLVQLGGMPHEEPNNVGEDVMVASVYDPWGNIIGIIYNPHFKSA
jgi:predicted enzyme related to lactoylglutathione lyase